MCIRDSSSTYVSQPGPRRVATTGYRRFCSFLRLPEGLPLPGPPLLPGRATAPSDPPKSASSARRRHG
eukprot:6604829-Alexandrium_andersonii.AAC.1